MEFKVFAKKLKNVIGGKKQYQIIYENLLKP